MSDQLPEQFSDLEPFVEKWAKGTENQRQAERISATPDELKDFYHQILPEIESILAYLDQYKIGEMPSDAKPLYWLALSLTEIAPHVELYSGNPEVPHAFEEARFVAEHGDTINC